MNKVMLIGRLTAKPELKYTSSNIPYCRFSIGINRLPDKNGNVVADFPNIIVWNKQAENVCKYQDKGSQIAVEGQIQTGSYDKDGQKVYTTEIRADRIEFLGSKNSNNSNSTPYDYEPEPVYTGNETPSVDIDSSDPFAEFGDSVSIDDNFLE